jgi:hypothetical protein
MFLGLFAKIVNLRASFTAPISAFLNMIKRLLISLFTLPALFCYGQAPNQEKLEALFMEQFCSCMGRDQSLSPAVLLDGTTSDCIIEFQKENADLIQKVVKEDYPENTTMTEQERLDDSGRRMVRNTIVPLVRNCEFYRTTLTKFKTNLIYQLHITQDNAKKSIQEMIQMEYKVKGTPNYALYYSLLGVMHEYVNDKNAALRYYEKSLELKETTAVKGLRELLILNGGFKPEQKEEKGTNKL